MEDLEKRLENLMQDPEGMAQLSALAKELMSGNKEEATETAGDSGGFDFASLAGLSGLSALTGLSDDGNSKLLLALKPYLRSERQSKVDEAVKLIKLMKLAPLIKELGV